MGVCISRTGFYNVIFNNLIIIPILYQGQTCSFKSTKIKKLSVEMLSDKSESDDGDNRPHNPGSSDRASSPVRPQGGATGSVSSSEGAVDEYSDAMRKLESAHSRMSQQSGTGTYRATLTDKTPSNINADAANSQD